MVMYAVSDHPFYGGAPGFGTRQAGIMALGCAVAASAVLPVAVAGRVLLIVVSSLAMLAFVEVAGEFLLSPRYRPIFQDDDKLIFKFVPDRRSVMTRPPVNGGETVMHRINSSGFRGPELRPAGAALRVVVYGDSFIHAFYTRDEETFVAQLGSALEKRLGKPVEAVNAGVSSYGPDQIALKMEGELDRLRPDLAVVSIFAGNDYGDLLRNKMFRLGPDGTLKPNRWQLEPRVREWLMLNQRESILVRALRSVADSLRSKATQAPAYNDLGFLLREAEREYRNYVIEGDNVVTNTHVDYYSADVSLTPSSPSARYKVALMRASLGLIRDVARKRGVPLAFLFIPHPMDVAKDYDGWRVDRARYPEYAERNQTGFLESAAREFSVPFFNLYDLYRANDANALYFRGGDDHWNSAGQRLAATAMADFLLAQGLPGPSPAAKDR